MPSSMAARIKKSRAPEGTLLLASRLRRGPRLVLGEGLATISRNGGSDDPRRVLGLERAGMSLAQVIAQDLGIDTDLRRELLGCKGLCFGCHSIHLLSTSHAYIVSSRATPCARRGMIY